MTRQQTDGHMSQIMTGSSSLRHSQNNHLIVVWDYGHGSTDSDNSPERKQTSLDRYTDGLTGQLGEIPESRLDSLPPLDPQVKI